MQEANETWNKSTLHLALMFLHIALGFYPRFPVEDRLDGVSNYGSWKPSVSLNLEQNEVKDFALIAVPVLDDATKQVAWRKNDVKAQKILMDSVKNHLVSHLSKSKTTKGMF